MAAEVTCQGKSRTEQNKGKGRSSPSFWWPHLLYNTLSSIFFFLFLLVDSCEYSEAGKELLVCVSASKRTGDIESRNSSRLGRS